MAKITISKCSCCGKPLSDPISVSLAMGPVCRVSQKNKSSKEKTEDMFNPCAVFTFEVIGGVLVLFDSGKGKSLTNDIENALAKVAKEGVNVSMYKIIYRDSEGMFDGVCCKNGKFSHFYSINESKKSAAILKVKNNDKQN